MWESLIASLNLIHLHSTSQMVTFLWKHCNSHIKSNLQTKCYQFSWQMSSFSLHIMLVMQKSHQKKKLDIEKGVECFKKFWWGLHVEWMLNESFWVHMSAHVISENDLNKYLTWNSQEHVLLYHICHCLCKQEFLPMWEHLWSW